jgi:DNA-binding NarL/FixJ family response regulator
MRPELSLTVNHKIPDSIVEREGITHEQFDMEDHVRTDLSHCHENVSKTNRLHWHGFTCVIAVVGLVISSYSFSPASVLLALVCPLIWFTSGSRLRTGILANTAVIVIVACAIGVRSFIRGNLTRDWMIITVAGVVIAVFTIMVGTMLHSVITWAIERAELLEDLKASQTDLAESYQELIATTTLTPIDDSPLSERETEVLGLVSHGYTNREIARRLYISPATVKTHMEHIFTKLGTTTRTQAVLVAHQEGLLESTNGNQD